MFYHLKDDYSPSDMESGKNPQVTQPTRAGASMDGGEKNPNVAIPLSAAGEKQNLYNK